MEVVRKLGISTVIMGKGLWPKDGTPKYADTFVHANSGYGITIEAGWIGDPKTSEITHGVHAALHANGLGIFEGLYPHAPKEKSFELWTATENIVATPGFTFKKAGQNYTWENFEEIPAGTIYATSNDMEYIAKADCQIIFAKAPGNIVIGNEACILVQKNQQQ